MSKILNNLICIVLALAFCCGVFAVAGAEGDTSSLTEEQGDALEVLRLLGIISDFYDYNTSVTENVTRADFVNIVARLIKADGYSGDEVYYYDVPKNHYAYGGICDLTELGIINGTGDGLFQPDAPLESGAAYKILLTVMGYDARAEADGGYPSGYIKTASRLGIYEKSSNGEYLTRGEMLVAIYRAMVTEMFVPTSFSADNVSRYEVSETDTILSVYHNVYYGEDKVNGASMISLCDIATDEPDEVIVGSFVCTSDVDMSDMLGEEAEFFMHYDKATEKGNIIWAESTGYTRVLKLEPDEITDFDENNFVLSYSDWAENIKKLSIDRSITVIYNGREVGADIDKIFELQGYSVKFIGSEGAAYDIAIISEYENYVAGSIDLSQYMIYDANENGKYISLHENMYEYLSIKNASGVEISFDKIEKGNVLSVYKSQDGKWMEVYVAASNASGILSAVKEGSHTELEVGGVAYSLPKRSSFLVPAVGANVILYIDHKGEVAYIETTAGNYFAAYIIQIARVGGAFSETLRFRLLRDNGKVEYIECADKVKLDGERTENTDDIINAFKNSETGEHKPQLALLGTNGDGKINDIDTAFVRPGVEDERHTLSVDVEKTDNVSYRWVGLFAIEKNTVPGITYTKSVAAINADTKIFKVPSAANAATTKDTDYTVAGKGSLSDYARYNIKTYKATERAGYTKWMEMEAAVATSYESKTVLVKEAAEVLTEDGDVRPAIVGYQGSTEVTLYAAEGKDDLFKDVREGTLLSITRNYRGEVDSIKVECTPEMEGPFENHVDVFWQTRGVVRGYVYDIVGDVIKISYDMPTEKNEAQVDQTSIIHTASVLVYDKTNEKNPISVGSLGDARTYYNVGNSCSRVILSHDAGVPGMFVIYK